MSPSIQEAIHFVSGSAASGQLMGAGARKGIRSDDKLSSVPCDVDPVRHAELRRVWDAEVAPTFEWRRPLDLAVLRAAIAGDEPVVLWGTRAYSDLISLWWALDGFGRLGAERSRFFLARPHAEHPLATVGHLPSDTARIALAAAKPITDDEWREGAELWGQYASASPLAFDEALRQRPRSRHGIADPDRRVLAMIGARGKTVAKAPTPEKRKGSHRQLPSSCARGDSNPHGVTH